MIFFLFVIDFIVKTGSCVPVQAKESWGYVDVRDGAHMFWWLYYANSSSASYKELPLVMWLQVCDLSVFNDKPLNSHAAVIYRPHVSFCIRAKKRDNVPCYFREVLGDPAVVLATLRKLDPWIETLSREKPHGCVN